VSGFVGVRTIFSYIDPLQETLNAQSAPERYEGNIQELRWLFEKG